MKRIVISFLVLLPLLSLGREWTSVSGSKVEAEFIRLSGNTVNLERSDGKQLAISMKNLVKADQEYVHSQSSGTSSAANKALERMRQAGARSRGDDYTLGDAEIAKLQTKVVDEKNPKNYMLFRASFGLPSGKAIRRKYAGKEEVPIRITATLYEVKKKGGKTKYDRQSGHACLYVLDEAGDVVISEKESLGKMCPT